MTVMEAQGSGRDTVALVCETTVDSLPDIGLIQELGNYNDLYFLFTLRVLKCWTWMPSSSMCYSPTLEMDTVFIYVLQSYPYQVKYRGS